MRRWNPLSLLFARSTGERYLAHYVLREHARGRGLAEVLDDPYVRNRSTPAQRARLLERPEVVEEIGEHTIAAMKVTLAEAGG